MLVRGLDTRKNHNTGLARATRMARGGAAAGGSEGPVGETWQWEQLYFEYEVGKACKCAEMCECDYSNTKMMPDELNKRRKKLRATDPCST